jgi:dCTP diphosphatase
VTLEELREAVARFAEDREWEQFHSVRNLVLAMVGEVGEVAEILQWTPDEEIEELLATGGRQRLAEELSDVLVYLVRIADRAGVDLESAVAAKLAANAEKYPADRVRGSSKKYTELTET